MDLLVILLILLLIFGVGGGVYTSRPGWSGPDIGGFLWVLVVVAVIVLIVRGLGVL